MINYYIGADMDCKMVELAVEKIDKLLYILICKKVTKILFMSRSI